MEESGERYGRSGAFGNEVILFETSTNTENIEVLNASAGESHEAF